MLDNNKKQINNRLATYGFIVVFAVGLYLRFYQHLMGRSLWEDEAHIAISFINFGYLGLTNVLPNFQTAPIFFLWGVETFSKLFGNSELSLRMFPFLVSVLSMPFFYFFVKALTKDTLTSLLGFFIYAVNISFIYYSSEVKSYTIDVSSYIIIGYLLLTNNEWVAKHRNKLLILAGVFFLLSSNVSAIILFCAGIYMVSKWQFISIRNKFISFKSIPKSDLGVFSIWLIVFAVNYFRFIYKHPYAIGMKKIWDWAFCPTPAFGDAFNTFMKARIDDSIFTDLLYFTDKYYFGYILLGILLLALFHIVRSKNYSILLFTILPILLHMAMSMLKIYPFYYRFILYLLPPFIILVCIGISFIFSFLAQRVHNLSTIPLLLFFCYCTSIKSLEKFPFWDKEIKPSLDFINKNYPAKNVFITTPWTLYLYYSRVGYIKNPNRIRLLWNLTPEQFYTDTVVARQKESFVLLYSSNGYSDGYGEVIKDLRSKNKILREFEYKTYSIAEVQP